MTPSPVPDSCNTFPKVLWHHANTRPHAIAMREKDMGIWQAFTWQMAAQTVRAIACGLADRGFKRGMHLAVVGDNRPRLYWSMMAAQSLGGIVVPLYQDAPSADLAFVLNNAEVAFIVAEDQEQVDKLITAKLDLPLLQHIFYDDARGLNNYDDPRLISLEGLMEAGRTFDASHPDFYQSEVDAASPTDAAVMLYTSGTTGNPKGVRQTHAALLFAAKGAMAFDKLTPAEEVLSYLPMAWVGDNLFSYAEALYVGFTVNCPEDSSTVMLDMREIGPTYFFAPPRIFEQMLTQVTIRMEDAGCFKRWLYRCAMDRARKATTSGGKGGGKALSRRLVDGWWELLIYAPLRNVLGLSRIRVAYTAGAAIGADLFRFYRSIGVNLKQLYGSTETCAYACMQKDGEVHHDTVGIPAPGVEIKLSDKGEVLVRSPALFAEYYKRPDATAEAFDREGFFQTGDAGVFTKSGDLKIIDRAADIGRLEGGTHSGALFAPNYLENKLKFFPYIKEAVAFGNGREMVCAFLNIDLSAVSNWADRKGVNYAGYVDLASKDEVAQLMLECVRQVNAELAVEEGMKGVLISRFLVLHKELDPDDDELTRTRKVRRKFISEKYAPLVQALYQGEESQYIETMVKFEDGRTGKVAATVRIHNAVQA